MSKSLGTGSQIAIGSAYGASKSFTSASNATECVLSFAADPSLVANDIVLIDTSGWPLLQGQTRRVKTVSGTGPYLVTLEGCDTTSTARFPAGEGAGALREVTTFTTIGLIADEEMQGGEQQYVDVPELALPITGKIPTEVTGYTARIPVYYESTTAAGTAAVKAAQDSAAPASYRKTHPSGDKVYHTGYWSATLFPKTQRNQARTIEVNVAFLPVDHAQYLT